MAERRKTDKQLAEMNADAILAHMRDMEREADDLNLYRSELMRALSARLEDGDTLTEAAPETTEEEATDEPA